MVWQQNRDPHTGLFQFGTGPTESLQQAAMTQIYAVLAWNPANYPLLY
jgi:hypothetical protein